MNTIWQRIAAAIGDATGSRFEPETVREIGGGCINRAACLTDGERSFFVKTNAAGAAPMFEAEREGLQALAVPGGPRIPGPVAEGTVDGAAFLVLEYVPMSRLDEPGWEALGAQLAALHRCTARRFGWHRDNAIGSTPQPNAWTEGWLAFWRDNRLGHQLALARAKGLDRPTLRLGERLVASLDELLAGHEPEPSILHGDLWSGNVAADADGNPVLFDPAAYYGDREADLAMTELFGRFHQRFYDAYAAAWPLEPGFEQRRTLYNLYHVLNHFILFGGGYAGQARAMMEGLLQRL